VLGFDERPARIFGWTEQVFWYHVLLDEGAFRPRRGCDSPRGQRGQKWGVSGRARSNGCFFGAALSHRCIATKDLLPIFARYRVTPSTIADLWPGEHNIRDVPFGFDHDNRRGESGQGLTFSIRVLSFLKLTSLLGL
jgi:hypothetical protein